MYMICVPYYIAFLFMTIHTQTNIRAENAAERAVIMSMQWYYSSLVAHMLQGEHNQFIIH